jgi:hypothetical protein
MKALKRLWLMYLLSSDEQYLMTCKRDGLYSSLDVLAFERRMQEMRVQLALLDQPIKKPFRLSKESI